MITIHIGRIENVEYDTKNGTSMKSFAPRLFFNHIISTSTFVSRCFSISIAFHFIHSVSKLINNSKLKFKKISNHSNNNLKKRTSVVSRSTLFRSIYRANIGGGWVTTVALVN
jgi:hypothetical protein